MAHLIAIEQSNATLTRVVNKRAWVWLSLTTPGFSSMFWHSVGQTKARSLGLSSGRGDEEVVMTMDTWESNDVSLPALRLFSSLQGQGRMGLSGSVWSPGRRLERTSSDTGIKAEITKQFIRNTTCTVVRCLAWHLTTQRYTNVDGYHYTQTLKIQHPDQRLYPYLPSKRDSLCWPQRNHG